METLQLLDSPHNKEDRQAIDNAAKCLTSNDWHE